MADDTVYGFEVRYLDFARQLMAEGITPHDLKEHYRDYEWVVNYLNANMIDIIRRYLGIEK